jgi:site-specific DNA recombinase
MALPSPVAGPRVALYGRVSTAAQADRNTIDAQRVFLRDYTAKQRMSVADEYYDDGLSGSLPLEERPEGRRLLADAASGRFTTVVVYKLDRFGRDLLNTQLAVRELERCGITIRSACEDFDLSDPNGRLTFQIFGAIAEQERATIRTRTVTGRDRAVAEGRWVGGTVPMGYDIRRDAHDRAGYLVPSERLVPELGITEAELIRRIYERIRDGSTATAEAERLNLAGVLSVRRSSGNKPPGRGTAWSPQRLGTLLHRSLYRGVHVFHAKSGDIERPVPPLVDDVTWHAVQKRLKENLKMGKKFNSRDYLLRGLIRCGTCGMSYYGSLIGRREPYYRCIGITNARHVGITPRCRSRSIRAERAEEIVWAQCEYFILNPDKFETLARPKIDRSAEQIAALVDRRTELRREIAELERQKERVIDLWKRDLIDEADMEKDLKATGKSLGRKRSEVEEIEAEEAGLRAIEAHFREVLDHLRAAGRLLAEAPDIIPAELKKQVIRGLVTRVTVETHIEEDGDRETHLTGQFRIGASMCIPVSTRISPFRNAHTGRMLF